MTGLTLPWRCCRSETQWQCYASVHNIHAMAAPLLHCREAQLTVRGCSRSKQLPWYQRGKSLHIEPALVPLLSL
jgi:hypothetical protein